MFFGFVGKWFLAVEALNPMRENFKKNWLTRFLIGAGSGPRGQIGSGLRGVHGTGRAEGGGDTGAFQKNYLKCQRSDVLADFGGNGGPENEYVPVSQNLR